MFRIVSAEEAVSHINSGNTLAINGFGGMLYPDFTIAALEKRFLEKGDIHNLTLFGTAAQGSAGLGMYLDRLAHEGLVNRTVQSFYETLKEISALAAEEKLAAYNLPQGVLSHLLEAAAGGKPGIISEIGLHTFVDPRDSGGKLNKTANEDFVELITIQGKEYLFYKTIPIDVAIIRGTTVDPLGNITFEKECLYMDALNMAQAAKANNGTVIVQVERKSGIPAAPKNVVVPGVLVDFVVLDPDQKQTKAETYNPYYTGELFMDPEDAKVYNDQLMVRYSKLLPRTRSAEQYYIAKRALLEVYKDSLINLGTGIPSLISGLAVKEGIIDDMVFTVESGVVGGTPTGQPSFGGAINAHVIYPMASQFNLYDGRGLDLAFVGAAQIDEAGNVNVSKIGKKLIGVGGFINITANARKVVFCTSMTGGKGLKTEFKDGRLSILEDAPIIKFKKHTEEISFSGTVSRSKKQPVMIVTERCVFEYDEDGLVLTEVAPGIDVQKDILEKMEFTPKIASPLKLMDEKIFSDQLLGLKDNL